MSFHLDFTEKAIEDITSHKKSEADGLLSIESRTRF
jgi:hypothetical protein